MAERGRDDRWIRRGAVALLGLAALWFVVAIAVDLAEEGRLRQDGIEVVAEVIAVRSTRSFTGYDDTDIAFTTRTGREVRTAIATQNVDFDVIRVRYDPDDPEDAEAVDDPAPLWLEDAVLALGLALVAAVVGWGPRLLAFRDRLAADEELAS